MAFKSVTWCATSEIWCKLFMSLHHISDKIKVGWAYICIWIELYKENQEITDGGKCLPCKGKKFA
jgi:hypothetical protein